MQASINVCVGVCMYVFIHTNVGRTEYMCIKTPCKNVICTFKHWAPVTWERPPRKWHSRIAIKTERPSGHRNEGMFSAIWNPPEKFLLTPFTTHDTNAPLSSHLRRGHPDEDRSKDRINMARRDVKASSAPLKPRRRSQDSLCTSRRKQSFQLLTLKFWPPNWGRKLCCFKPLDLQYLSSGA